MAKAALVSTAAPIAAPVAPVVTESAVPTETAGLTRAGSESVTEASAPGAFSAVLEQQGLTDVSEADLMGLSDTPEEKPANSEPLVEEKPEEKAEEKTEELVEETVEEKDPVKPPKGFVPLAAIHEVRGENKYLKEQIAQLNERLKAAPIVAPTPVVAPKPSVYDDFEVLTDDEFQALATDSPSDALLYMKQLNGFQEYQRVQEENKIADENQQEYISRVFSATTAEMEKAVPGIFDDNSTVAEEFREFAVSAGFTDDMFYLTNPATQVIIPGESEPLLLGEQAAQVIKLLANFKSKGPAKIDIDKIRADLRREIESEVMSKLKSNQTFKSLSDVPNSNENRPEFKGKMLSEAEFARLSSKEQDLYLSGE